MSELKEIGIRWEENGELHFSHVYLKSNVDKVIADLEESHKKEVEQLLMEISKLKKLVEAADKILKSKGGFTVKDVKFKGIKLEGMPSEPEV